MPRSSLQSRDSNFKSRRATVLFMLALLVLFPSLCRAWQGKVLAVAGGDTLTVLHDGKKEQVRLYGIECPKKQQDKFQQAREFTLALVFGKVVEIQPRGKDRFAGTLATITADGKNLSSEIVGSGLAWVYFQDRKHPEYQELVELEKQAKVRGIGIWAVSNPIPPWDFKPGKPQKPVYSGDVRAHIFHSTSCPDYDCKSCIATFKDRSRAISAGYKPCPLCNP